MDPCRAILAEENAMIDANMSRILPTCQATKIISWYIYTYRNRNSFGFALRLIAFGKLSLTVLVAFLAAEGLSTDFAADVAWQRRDRWGPFSWQICRYLEMCDIWCLQVVSRGGPALFHFRPPQSRPRVSPLSQQLPQNFQAQRWTHCHSTQYFLSAPYDFLHDLITTPRESHRWPNPAPPATSHNDLQRYHLT